MFLSCIMTINKRLRLLKVTIRPSYMFLVFQCKTNSVIYLKKLMNGGIAGCETKLKLEKKQIIIQEILNICLKITFSITLPIVHRGAIDLQFDVRCLSPLLCKGSTNEVFHCSGKVPSERETFNYLVRSMHTAVFKQMMTDTV